MHSCAAVTISLMIRLSPHAIANKSSTRGWMHFTLRRRAIPLTIRCCWPWLMRNAALASPLGLLDQLAFGTAMDVEEENPDQNYPRHPIQYRNFQELERYCYNVASVVGLVCIHIFGYRDPSAEPLAERLGLAFQLTNIIRDVKEDAILGRVYLPQDDLGQFGIRSADLATMTDPSRIRALLHFESQRALENYAAGDELLHLISEDSQPALWVLINIYRGLLQKIARLNYDVFTRKVSLSLREKLSIFAKGFVKRLL